MLLLHVGPHKTATTYIQKNLFSSKKTFAKVGWTYPEEGLMGNAHHNLVYHTHDYLDASGTQHSALATTLSAAENVVISAEGLCRFKIPQFQALANLHGRGNAQIVYALRDPASIFYSFWQEEVKQGHTRSLLEKFSEHFADPVTSRILNPFRDLNPLIACNRFDIRIMFFDDIVARKQDICEVLVRNGMGIEHYKSPDKTRVNESYTIELTEFLRILTKRHAKSQKFVTSNFRNAFINGTSTAQRDEITATIKAGCQAAKKTLSIPRDSQFYRYLNTQVKEKLFRLNIENTAPQTTFPAEQGSFSYYDEADVIQNNDVIELLRRYDKLAEGVDFSPTRRRH